jgi:DNA-binding transcriptional ArsR family regulator
MDMIYEIRRRYLVQKQTITDIAKDMGLSRPTVRKHILTVDEPHYKRTQPVAPKLGSFEAQFTQWLVEDAKLTRSLRRSGQRLFEGLQTIGYSGAYDSVQRFVRRWKSSHQGPRLSHAFVPLLFLPGDACQFAEHQIQRASSKQQQEHQLARGFPDDFEQRAALSAGQGIGAFLGQPPGGRAGIQSIHSGQAVPNRL